MDRRTLLLGAVGSVLPAPKDKPMPENPYDLVIVGGTPGGLCAAIAAARLGSRALVLERTAHIGGLPANGLGATDIATRAATRGLFGEFVGRVKRHYAEKYGADSRQVKDCSDGYHFEPHVAEQVFEEMVRAEPKITVLRNRQFDAEAKNVQKEGARLTAVTVTERASGAKETYRGAVFLDATYEGDLAAAAGCAWETRREGKKEYGEPFAGRVYRPWGTGPLGEGSTEEGDDTLQAYNYRLCLTDVPQNRVAIEKPADYRRDDYASLVDDVKRGWLKHFTPPAFIGKQGNDVGAVNPVRVPNGKTDTNNHHRSFVSTDLPEENWAYPREGWAWRDRFATRLRDYTLGLLWFCQNDPALPESFRAEAKAWGLSRDEYADNNHFPRQIYVREGRRITGEYLFTARDCIADADLPRAYAIMEGKEKADPNARPKSHRDSITASHYAIDSHAIRKREPNRVHLDGFLGLSPITKPYQVPYGVMVPKGADGLLTPVPCSASHLGFGTLRMEPCWMALGQAAGIAAHLARTEKVTPRQVNRDRLQRTLLAQGAVLTYLRDVTPAHPQWTALQIAGCHGCFPELDARPDAPIDGTTAVEWAKRAGKMPTPPITTATTRAAYAALLFG
jgi:hypothetical protein